MPGSLLKSEFLVGRAVVAVAELRPDPLLLKDSQADAEYKQSKVYMSLLKTRQLKIKVFELKALCWPP